MLQPSRAIAFCCIWLFCFSTASFAQPQQTRLALAKHLIKDIQDQDVLYKLQDQFPNIFFVVDVITNESRIESKDATNSSSKRFFNFSKEKQIRILNAVPAPILFTDTLHVYDSIGFFHQKVTGRQAVMKISKYRPDLKSYLTLYAYRVRENEITLSFTTTENDSIYSYHYSTAGSKLQFLRCTLVDKVRSYE